MVRTLHKILACDFLVENAIQTRPGNVDFVQPVLLLCLKFLHNDGFSEICCKSLTKAP